MHVREKGAFSIFMIGSELNSGTRSEFDLSLMLSSQTKTKQNKNLSAKNPKNGIGIKMKNIIMSLHTHILNVPCTALISLYPKKQITS